MTNILWLEYIIEVLNDPMINLLQQSFVNTFFESENTQTRELEWEIC